MSHAASSKSRFLDDNDLGYASAKPNTFAIWIVTPSGYSHSQCFDDIAFSLQVAFRNLGFKAPVMNNPKWISDTTLVLGPNLLPGFPRNLVPPNAIFYNLEQIYDGSPWLTKEFLALAGQNKLWDYNHINKHAWLKLGVNTDAICEVGFVKELQRIEPQKSRDIDVLFVGSLNERRKTILERLQSEGVSVHWLFNVYGEERDQIIARAKLLLNFHQHETQIFEIIRVSYLLANRCCVVSETGCNRDAEQHFSEGVEFSSYDSLIHVCLSLLADEDKQENLRHRGYEAIKDFDQTKLLEKALLESQLIDETPAPNSR